MVKLGFAVLVMCLVACNSGSNSTGVRLDSIGKKFDSAAKRSWDSTQQKAKDIKESIENKLEHKDSAEKQVDTL